jgi:hypothetical protein
MQFTSTSIFPFLTLGVIGLAVSKIAGFAAISWWIVFSPWWLLILGLLACAFLSVAGCGIFFIICYLIDALSALQVWMRGR